MSVPAFQHSKLCQEMCAEVEAERSDWKKRWLHHCKTCEGAGGKSYAGSYWTPPDFEPCPDCQENDEQARCPRCGVEGETWDEEKGEAVKCSKCGWDPFNPDACPPPWECYGDCVEVVD